MGVAAHALDELKDRPLRTAIPAPVLVALAAVSLGGAVAIGIGAAYAWGFGLLVFIAIGAVAVPAYNLELALHNEFGFALALGCVSRSDRLFRRGADAQARGSRGGSVRVRDERRSAHALDAGARSAAPSTRRPRESPRSSARCGCSHGRWSRSASQSWPRAYDEGSDSRDHHCGRWRPSWPSPR